MVLGSLEHLHQQFSKLPARELPTTSKILIPPRVMPQLLHLSIDQWDRLKNYSNIKKLRSTRDGRGSYTVEELEQIAREIRSSNSPVDQRKSLETAIRSGFYYELQEARDKLSVCERHFSYLIQQNALEKNRY